eukprot:5305100-Pyramimonas_sp.AAC.1
MGELGIALTPYEYIIHRGGPIRVCQSLLRLLVGVSLRLLYDHYSCPLSPARPIEVVEFAIVPVN